MKQKPLFDLSFFLFLFTFLLIGALMAWALNTKTVREMYAINQNLQRENQKLTDANDALMQVCEGKVNQ